MKECIVCGMDVDESITTKCSICGDYFCEDCGADNVCDDCFDINEREY
jgi:hypothetical protein